MISLDNGVRLHGMRAELVVALVVVDQCYSAVNDNAVITSVTDGVHMRASIHYVGGAFDVRLPESDREAMRKRIAARLGGDFDIVVETDHIHVEWQPKEPY